jgi:hypothetical protein
MRTYYKSKYLVLLDEILRLEEVEFQVTSLRFAVRKKTG